MFYYFIQLLISFCKPYTVFIGFGDIYMEKNIGLRERAACLKKAFLISLDPELGIYGSAKLRPNQLSSMAARVS
jgi:hypothetical protein